MRKVALVFILAVLLPSLGLAWLAIRSLRDQQFVLERQQALLYQRVTDAKAIQINDLIAQHQRDFIAHVQSMLESAAARNVASSFDESLRNRWPLAKVGFVVTTGGDVLAPKVSSREEVQRFQQDTEPFIQNRQSAEVFVNVLEEAAPRSSQHDPSGAQAPSLAEQRGRSEQSWANNVVLKSPQPRSVSPQKKSDQQRADKAQVAERVASAPVELSKVAPAEAEFNELIGDASEGRVARFVNDRLNLLFWYRPAAEPHYIFGAQLDLGQLRQQLMAIAGNLDRELRGDLCVAILDDTARPAGISHDAFQANWKHPFVATEIGDALPHWEVTAYLLNPHSLTESARIVKLTLGLLVALLVVAIGTGSWLIVRDLNRHLTLARQKTDFVSNVSHELKTPLTSIRMFAELLADGRVADSEKQRSYLNIITAETARLTRLINNVLDFARMERGEKKYNFRDCDLNVLVRDSVESYRPHLENNGFKLETRFAGEPLPVRGDCDAVAQVIVNLLSNAEKYSGDRKEIMVTVSQCNTPLPCAEVRIADRGLGVPAGSEQRIFEQFYRAHDSLSSGIQGSGLGLTLARQIARAHGGDVTYEARHDGGSCFSLRLPLAVAEVHDPTCENV